MYDQYVCGSDLQFCFLIEMWHCVQVYLYYRHHQSWVATYCKLATSISTLDCVPQLLLTLPI